MNTKSGLPSISDKELFKHVVSEEADAILRAEASRPRSLGWTGRFADWRSLPLARVCETEWLRDLGVVVRCIRGSENRDAIVELERLLRECPHVLPADQLDDHIAAVAMDVLRPAVQCELLARGVHPYTLDRFAEWVEAAKPSPDRQNEVLQACLTEGRMPDGVDQATVA